MLAGPRSWAGRRPGHGALQGGFRKRRSRSDPRVAIMLVGRQARGAAIRAGTWCIMLVLAASGCNSMVMGPIMQVPRPHEVGRLASKRVRPRFTSSPWTSAGMRSATHAGRCFVEVEAAAAPPRSAPGPPVRLHGLRRTPCLRTPRRLAFPPRKPYVDGSGGRAAQAPIWACDQLASLLGMVEAPSSNLGTSTSSLHNDGNEVTCTTASVATR